MKVRLSTILELFRNNTIEEEGTVTITTNFPAPENTAYSNDIIRIVIGFSEGISSEKADSVYDDLVEVFDAIVLNAATDSIYSNDVDIEICIPDLLIEMPDSVHNYLRNSGMFSREKTFDDFGESLEIFKLEVEDCD